MPDDPGLDVSLPLDRPESGSREKALAHWVLFRLL